MVRVTDFAKFKRVTDVRANNKLVKQISDYEM